MTELAQKFRADLDEVHRALVSLPEAMADVPWRAGGWTRKQIVGHLLDSASNNRHRFVRASTEGANVVRSMHRMLGSLPTVTPNRPGQRC